MAAGGTPAIASARALVASQLAGMSEQAARNIVAQYGPVAQLPLTHCKTIGKAPTRHTGT